MRAPNLFPLADGRIQIVGKGPVTPFMDTRHLLLVENRLARVLQDLSVANLTLTPVMLYDPSRGVDLATHTKLEVRTHVGKAEVISMSGQHLGLYLMDNTSCFVTDRLKILLRGRSFPYLIFSRGLQGFVCRAD